jgi:hypothetical protein
VSPQQPEFKIINEEDVELHFGKYKNHTFKELATSFAGLMYLKWLYKEHKRLPEEARTILKSIYQQNKKYYEFPYSCPEVWAYSFGGRYPTLEDDVYADEIEELWGKDDFEMSFSEFDWGDS